MLRIFVGRVSSAPMFGGVGLEFEAITAVILGGASLKGGRADFLATLLGALILGIVYNGLALAKVSTYYIEFVKGFILLFAVIINKFTEKYQYR